MTLDGGVQQGNQISYWKQLGAGADLGVFTMTAEVARACDLACQDYLVALEAHGRAAQVLARVEGMGDFQSGRQLAQKFSLKASGGELSLDAVLRQHAEIIKAMQDFFRRFFSDVEAQNNKTAARMAGNEPR